MCSDSNIENLTEKIKLALYSGLIGVDFDNTLVRLTYDNTQKEIYLNELKRINKVVNIRTLWGNHPELRGSLHEILCNLEKSCKMSGVNIKLLEILAKHPFVIISDSGEEIIRRFFKDRSIMTLKGICARNPLDNLKPYRLKNIPSQLSLYIGDSSTDKEYAANLKIPFISARENLDGSF